MGSGSLRDGVLCCLACLAEPHDDHFRDRIQQGCSSPD